MRTDPLAFLGTELEALKQQGLYRKLRVLDGRPESHTTYDHKSVVNLSSNNYLGLTTHPKLVKAALGAVEKFGVGSGAVRTISGTMEMHMEPSGGWPRSSTSNRWSSFKAASPPTPA